MMWEKNEGKKSRKGCFLYFVECLSFIFLTMKSHEKQQNFCDYTSLELHPKLTGMRLSKTKESGEYY